MRADNIRALRVTKRALLNKGQVETDRCFVVIFAQTHGEATCTRRLIEARRATFQALLVAHSIPIQRC